ncbi:MAG: M28 family peptidase [Gemmatimonadetes bacterium]|nr:M28 family peptidase [Gemmatimonadota bacterium]
MATIPQRRVLAAAPTALIVGIVGAVTACSDESSTLSLDVALDSLSVESFLVHQAMLSSDAMGGRRPGTAGYDAAAAYLIEEARASGLEPGGEDGTYLQPIDFRTSRVDPSSVVFSVGGQTLVAEADFAVSPRVLTTDTDLRAPLVFAGFGISAPELGYDDFASIDVAGKLVVVVPGAPDAFGSLERTVLSSSKVRDAELRSRGAAGVVMIQSVPVGGRLASRPRTGYVPPDGEPAEELAASLRVSRRVASTWMANAGRDFDDALSRLRAGEPVSMELGVEGVLTARFVHDTFESANVAALLQGVDPALADEYLVVTAHLDHLGTGAPLAGDSIYNGTLDNASGSAAILTLAETLTRMEPPDRSILFLWVTAEESGMLGSEYFARFPTVAGRVIANQNMDGVMGMIAAATDILAFGYEHSNLSEAVDFAVERAGTPVSPDPTPEENLFIRSDQYAFVRQGIPAIWVQAGRTSVDPSIDAQSELDRWIVERYHKPTDDLDQPMDLAGVRVELENNLLVAHFIANEMEAIRWDTESFLYRLRPGG